MLIDKKISIIIILGGTSGTGKSTLSSLLASRIGISTVLSTDSIRHILRNFLEKDEHGEIFSSTYEAYKGVNTTKFKNLIKLDKAYRRGRK